MNDTTIAVASGPQANTTQHIPMSKEIYLELLEGLKELDAAFRPTAESVNARRWVEHQWQLAQAGQEGKAE